MSTESVPEVPGAKLPHISSPNSALVSYHSPAPSSSSQPSRNCRRLFISNDPKTSTRGTVVLESSDEEGPRALKRAKRVHETPLIAIEVPPLAFPKSLYDGHQYPIPAYLERDVLKEILAETKKELPELKDSDPGYFIDADLEDFVIYRPHRSNRGNRQKRVDEAPLANEFVSLHEINEWTVREFLFDGVVWFSGQKRYVERVAFDVLSIGGYGEMDRPAQLSDLWIQSHHGKRLNVWYRLRRPAPEYKRYHDPFLWMAELAKHVVDYLSSYQKVCLNDFRDNFSQWLEHTYGPDELVNQWLESYGSLDLRHAVASQANFLWCQASQVDEDLEKQPVWSEIHPRFLTAIPESQETDTKPEMLANSLQGDKIMSRRKTTVTPYVHGFFKHLPCSKFLYCQTPAVNSTEYASSKSVDKPDAHRNKRLPGIQLASHFASSNERLQIQIGDVVALPPDSLTTWKSEDIDWLGYVQGITETKRGLELGLLWLYRAPDTHILKVRYPHQDELFLSDHCNCGDAPIYTAEVTRKLQVAFFGGPATVSPDYFVRQSYAEADGAWRTLQESDFSCSCRQSKTQSTYSRGDTLLVSIKKVLEPVIYIRQESGAPDKAIKVRRLLRRNRDYGDDRAMPNELVLTNRVQTIAQKAVYRDCHVRFYTEEERERGKIPPPYSRQGMGDHYCITSQDLEVERSGLQNVRMPLPFMIKEGWDPYSNPPNKLRGLDLFCGGGNFGRGLEEGGAVEFNWAVDWNTSAIHTYKANLKPNRHVQLFLGSVNDYLSQAMQGKRCQPRLIAQQGEVDVIAAGSNCQGFSIANPNRGNDRSLLNVSMVASVIAFVDFYRPKYVFMENVPGISSGPATENVLSLTLSALVGMGYQVGTSVMDAWNHGSPQSRSRVIISAAAAGLTPLLEPPHTHSHPKNVKSASLGELPNGLRLSSRYTAQTPFKHVTTLEATRDLPPTDARTSCIRYPDHRMSRTLSTLCRVQLGCVPRFPGGCTFVKAAKAGYMPRTQMEAFDWSNKVRARDDARGWQRLRRHVLMPTVLTEPRPDDGVGGNCLHWDQHRLLTVMEVRRGQSVPDDEVLIGLPREQWKIVGNSVARSVALALGMSLRKSWLADVRRLGNGYISDTSKGGETNSLASHQRVIRSKLVSVEICSSAALPSTPPYDKNRFIPPLSVSVAQSQCSTGRAENPKGWVTEDEDFDTDVGRECSVDESRISVADAASNSLSRDILAANLTGSISKETRLSHITLDCSTVHEVTTSKATVVHRSSATPRETYHLAEPGIQNHTNSTVFY